MFEVWNDAQWVDGNKIFTFKTLVEAIEFVKHMTNKTEETEAFVDFWNTKTADVISIGGWCIGELGA